MATKTVKKQEEKEIVHLMMDNNEYKYPQFVSVNNKRFLLKRGVQVKVPKSVKEVIDNAEKQRQKSLELQMGLQNDYDLKLKTI